MHITKITFKPWQMVLVLSAWLTFVYNGALLYSLPQRYQLTHINAVIAITVVLFLLNGLLAAALIWPRIWRLSAIIIIALSALSFYFTQQYGVYIDSDMLINVLETDWSESSALVTPALLISLAVFAILPSVLLYFIQIEWPQRHRHLVLQQLLLVCGLLIGLATTAAIWYQPLSSLVRNHRELKHQVIPLNWISASVSLVKSKAHLPAAYADLTADARKTDVQPGDHHRVMVLIIGETARADHFSINGYDRNTTPRLQQLVADGSVINFGAVAACGTATAISLPCLLSYQNRDQFDATTARNSSSLLDVAQAAGYHVVWIDNNSGCKDMCNRVTTIDLSHADTDPLCAERDYCNDRILTRALQQQLQSINQDTLIVLHMIGSHGPAYYQRSLLTDKLFQSECSSNSFDQCSTEQIVNSYDNSLRSTDAVIAESIALLSQSNLETTLLYVSDHGESLGEYGTFLHGMPYWLAPAAQREVPMLLWLSNSYQENQQINRSCLTSAATTAVSHDNIFHSVLGLLEVTSPLYRASLDLTHGCGQFDAHTTG